MDKRITRYNSLKAMKSDEYRSWQRLPGSERIRAVMDLNLEPDAPRLQRTVIRFQRRTGQIPDCWRVRGFVSCAATRDHLFEHLTGE
jgi:hypothetical protein